MYIYYAFAKKEIMAIHRNRYLSLIAAESKTGKYTITSHNPTRSHKVQAIIAIK